MSTLVANVEVLWSGVIVTLALAVLSTGLALPAGLALAIMRSSPVPGFRWLGTIYVAVTRNVPLAVVFFFSAFVLPQLGVRVSYFTFAVIALVTYYSSFFCEAIRSGINAVPLGQAEAARSIGLSYPDCLRFVVLPQAMRCSIPPVVNVMIALVKNTAVASAFGVAESLSAMQRLANDESAAVIAILLATATIYLCITVPLGFVALHVERRSTFSK